MTDAYDDNGIRFEYPSGWELDITEDGPRTTVAVQAADGIAFAMVTVDDDAPDPSNLADEALAAMREEYPDLDAHPARETIAGHPAIGHDIEFFSLDLTNSCTIRCLQTPRRTLLIFGQWSELDDDEARNCLAVVRRTLEETDA